MSLDYVMIGSNDLKRSRVFYDAVFAALGAKPMADYPGYAFSYQFANGASVWVTRPYNKKQAAPGNGMMPGFRLETPEKVKAAHAAALANGGINEGDPGPRPHYGPEFYGAYARDPDGNKMSFVCSIRPGQAG